MKFLAYLVCYCIYPFSFLFPRNKRKWAFGSFRGGFDGNAKFLMAYVSEQMPEIESVWLSTNRQIIIEVRKIGLKAYSVFSPKGVWFALTSKFWFFNAYSSDIMFCLSGNATLVNLWHGLPMRRIEFDIDKGPLAKRYQKQTLKERFFHPEVFKRPDYLISSSRMYSEMFSHAFRIGIDRCLEMGSPRNDILTWPESRRQDFVNRYEPESTKRLIDELKSKGYHKVFIYLPTWRDTNADFLSQGFDFERFDEELCKDHSLLVFKCHANTKLDAILDRKLTNVRFLSSTTDVYPIMPYTDVLITDYSSVLYDFLLMENKSIFLYLFDYDDFAKERSFIWPFDEMTLGQSAYDFETLLRLAHNSDATLDGGRRQYLLQKCWGDCRGNASEKIVSFFMQQS